MNYIYGKQSWKTFERGEENGYLMTNGLGGFSSLTMIGSCARNDHAVLMACTHAPNRRVNLIHRLEEVLRMGDREIMLSSQDYADRRRREEGYLRQSRFTFEDYPRWSYLTDGVEIEKTIVLMQDSNTVGISYEIRNRSRQEVILRVTPHLQFVPKGAMLPLSQKFTLEGNRIDSNGYTLYIRTDGQLRPWSLAFCEDLYYAYDAADGRTETGRTAVNHCVETAVGPGEKRVMELVYGMEPELPSVGEIAAQVTRRRAELCRRAGFRDETACALSLAADQFISSRVSTGSQTILAGFPFFEDWGRDTMIALGGCCLATRRYDTARAIFKTFMAYCRKGLMPNLFPEGKDAPRYNTVDAALLFILAVYEYYSRTADLDFVKEAYETMAEIVDWYVKGTDFGIRMDTDGLIMAGRDYDQVTWMDVRIGDILPTPRHGKPVEINAYWYNALRIMEKFQELLGQEKESGRDGSRKGSRDYGSMAEKTRQSFREKFWNEEAGCLRDVLSDTKADEQIRCNQIWAISQPFSLLEPWQERQVVETVFEKLYTPYGLRTLDPADGEFHPVYGGPQSERDLAYHQGTVWVFPLGAYYLAYLKVNEYSSEAVDLVKRQLTSISAALWEGCIGQLPEIFDGGNPVLSKGCFAQAWSVGEILRVYDVLERRH